MKTFELKGSLRTDVGKKSAKKIRKNEQIPCVLYGGKENVNFSVNERDVQKLVYTPNVYIIDLDIDGKKHLAAMLEMQTHPVTDKILHMDFQEVFEDKPMVIDVPVKITGSAIGVRKGGRQKVFKRYLKVKALPKYIPDTITVDVSDIEIGKNIKISDIKLENASFTERQNELIVGVYYARTVVEETPATAAGATATGATPSEGTAAGAATPAAAATPAPAPGAAAPKK